VNLVFPQESTAAAAAAADRFPKTALSRCERPACLPGLDSDQNGTQWTKGFVSAKRFKSIQFNAQVKESSD